MDSEESLTSYLYESVSLLCDNILIQTVCDCQYENISVYILHVYMHLPVVHVNSNIIIGSGFEKKRKEGSGLHGDGIS